MKYYLEDENLIICDTEYSRGTEISEERAAAHAKSILWLNGCLGINDRVAFRVNHVSQVGVSREDEKLLWHRERMEMQPVWLQRAIKEGRVTSVNAAHSDWQDWLKKRGRKSWRVHIVGLGDVGGMLLTGLRLLGGGDIRELGLYDPDPAKCQRWHREIGQICHPFEADNMSVGVVEPESLFDCDLFVFCASRSVPPLDKSVTDVRMVQYAGNADILKPYAQQAVREGFTGLFAVVSDPVDQLCQFVLSTMNHTAAAENLRPVKADQVRGYGLGVMNGRASWYARQIPELASYLTEGRAYGPHGKGLIIANSIDKYNDEMSRRLTDLTLNANFEVRNSGFKPFVAPALSSGAISLMCTLRGQWHYSAVALGGIFMGCKNRLVDNVQETECLDMPEVLKDRIRITCGILRESL